MRKTKESSESYCLGNSIKRQKIQVQTHAVNQMTNKDMSQSLTLKGSMLAVRLLTLFHFPALTCLFEMFHFTSTIKNIYQGYDKLPLNETEK